MRRRLDEHDEPAAAAANVPHPSKRVRPAGELEEMSGINPLEADARATTCTAPFLTGKPELGESSEPHPTTSTPGRKLNMLSTESDRDLEKLLDGEIGGFSKPTPSLGKRQRIDERQELGLSITGIEEREGGEELMQAAPMSMPAPYARNAPPQPRLTRSTQYPWGGYSLMKCTQVRRV